MRGGDVVAVLDDGGVGEVLVEVVDVLDDAVLAAAGHRDVVEHRQVLHQLAQSDATGVGADRDAVLGREQQDGEVLVHPGDACGVDLDEVDRVEAWSSCLNTTLLATCSPVATLTGCPARTAAWPSTSSGLVGSSIQYGS